MSEIYFVGKMKILQRLALNTERLQLNHILVAYGCTWNDTFKGKG